MILSYVAKDITSNRLLINNGQSKTLKVNLYCVWIMSNNSDYLGH